LETLKIALLDLNRHFGGGTVALGNLAQALSRKGHEVHLILGMKNLPSRLVNTHLNDCHLYHTLGYKDIFDMPRLMCGIRNDLLRLYSVHKFDILNVQGVNGLFVPSELHNRLIVTLHGNNLARGFALLRCVYKSSDMLQATRYAFTNYMRNISGHFMYGNLEKTACKRAKLVIALTSCEAYYAKEYYNLPEEKIRIVPNSVVLPKDSFNHELAIPEDKELILSVSALEMIKGIPLLVKAAKEILSTRSDVIYVFVGDGPLRVFIRKLASRFPRRVIMFPQIHSGLTVLYERSKMLVHGSFYEACCLSIAEAMLMGKPVVALGMASIPELVTNNVTGYLVESLHAKDLAEKAINLLDDDKKARRMGSAAKKKIEELYNPKRIAYKTENVYKEVLAS